MMSESTKEDEMREAAAEKPAPRRMCAGCAKRDDADGLVRVVLDLVSGELAVDMAGGRFGRGAHVHTQSACLEKAFKGGFAKAFKTKVEGSAPALATQIIEAADRRIEGLISGARRAKHLAMGADAVVETVRSGEASSVVVAMDAAAAADLSEVRKMVDSGKAVVWKNKRDLGAIFGRDEVAVIAVKNAGVSQALMIAARSRSEAWSVVSTTTGRTERPECEVR
jgi:predicted RNA-binding protein YlxR (DUF448 family)/ribosomal protein L30E